MGFGTKSCFRFGLLSVLHAQVKCGFVNRKHNNNYKTTITENNSKSQHQDDNINNSFWSEYDLFVYHPYLNLAEQEGGMNKAKHNTTLELFAIFGNCQEIAVAQ